MEGGETFRIPGQDVCVIVTVFISLGEEKNVSNKLQRDRLCKVMFMASLTVLAWGNGGGGGHRTVWQRCAGSGES